MICTLELNPNISLLSSLLQIPQYCHTVVDMFYPNILKGMLILQIFTPLDDKYVWILAKMWFGLADSNYHQANIHLGKQKTEFLEIVDIKK